MQLIIDVGNTRIKAAVFEKDSLLERVFFERSLFTLSIGELAGKYPIKKTIISSVGRLSDADRRSIQLRFPTVLLDHQTPVPFVNKYSTPETLGVDRIALVTAFAKAYPNKSGLIIDAGSCITYDYINKENEYLGGAISPGIGLRYEAMHQYTAHLPLLEKNEDFILIGDSTENAMHSGVLQGILCEIDGVIDRYKEQFNVDIVILTGGDSEFLSKRLKNSIFAHSNFLLEGLNYILTLEND